MLSLRTRRFVESGEWKSKFNKVLQHPAKCGEHHSICGHLHYHLKDFTHSDIFFRSLASIVTGLQVQSPLSSQYTYFTWWTLESKCHQIG